MTKLALLLGEGALAHAAYQAAQKHFGAGHVVGMALEPLVWPELPHFDLDDLPNAIIQAHAHLPTHVCVAGRVDLSPSRRRNMAASIGLHGKDATSDFGVEQTFGLVAEKIGAVPIGVHQFAKDLLAGEGQLFGPPVDFIPEIASSLLKATRQFGETDLGQAMVFAGQQPLAGEDIGGTDALLKRVSELQKVLDIPSGLWLVKAKKPQQSGVGDLPTIGINSIEHAAKAGVSVILVEAGQTLLLNQERLDEACVLHNVAIIGGI